MALAVVYERVADTFRRYLADAGEHLARTAPSALAGISNHVKTTETIRAELSKMLPKNLETLVRILKLDREWKRSASNASALARGQNDRWLSQFSPTRVAASRELREEAADAFRRSRAERRSAISEMLDAAAATPANPRDLLAAARDGLTGEMVELAVRMGADLPEQTLRDLRRDALVRAAAVSSADETSAVPLLSQVGTRASAKGPQAEFAGFVHDLGSVEHYDTRHLYDPAHAARIGVSYPDKACIDEAAIRYARFTLRGDDPAPSLEVVAGVGAVRPDDATPRHLVRAGGAQSVFTPFMNPAELWGYQACSDAILRSHLDARWAEFAQSRSEPRAGETAPLRAFTNQAERELSAIAKRVRAAPYEEIEREFLGGGWLGTAATAAYKASAEAWTNPRAAPREQFLAELAQVAELTSGLQPLFAAHWRKNVPEDELAAQKAGERELFLKVRAENALSELAEELSSRRSDLLIFREPLALAASGAAIE